jgi:hypothetical protein
MNHIQARRRLLLAAAAGTILSPLFWPRLARAGALDAISRTDATAALRAALDKGSVAAVDKLGVVGGFLNNPKVKIPLPPAIAKIERALRFAGLQDQADQLVQSMNTAAEQAVPMARPLLANAVKSMTVTDAKKILSGGDTSVTDYFKDKTAQPLSTKFLPAVKTQTDKVGLARQYNSLIGKVGELGLAKNADPNIESYVTRKALDGLYTMIGDEERAIRANPIEYGSAVISKVFGALK